MVLIARPAAIAINQDNGELAVYSRGKMTILARGDDSRFERRLEKSIDSGEDGPIILGDGGGTLLVGRENGQLIEYDAATLAERASFTVERDHAPRFITAAPGGGRFAIVFHHGYVWTYDSSSQRMRRPPVTGQGTVSCAVFSSADQILVADRRTRVTQYDATNWSVLDRKTPFLKLPEIVQTYVLNPLYVVFPKPGELDNTIEYLLSGKTTPRPRGPARQELEVVRKHIHPWTPVWSSGVFVVVALL